MLREQLLEEYTVGDILDIYNTDRPIYRKYEAQNRLALIQSVFELADDLKHRRFLEELTKRNLTTDPEEQIENEAVEARYLENEYHITNKEAWIDNEDLIIDNSLEK